MNIIFVHYQTIVKLLKIYAFILSLWNIKSIFRHLLFIVIFLVIGKITYSKLHCKAEKNTSKFF